MIHINDKKECCGCGACEQVCPRKCIEFTTDTEGFRYPEIKTQDCIDCKLCEKVCPMLNTGKPTLPLSVEAMIFNDEQKRLESSSGGIFTAIAEEIIHRGGVVFGASYTKDWHVVHTYTESIEGIKVFRGSKYFQCETANAYTEVKNFLKQGRLVLFSGTPCQVRGLLLLLRKPYENLFTIDFICHGVPSYDVFMAYLRNEKKNRNIESDIQDIRFRNKINGWKKFNLTITAAKQEGPKEIILDNSAYMKGFGANLYLRPSCYNCPVKNFSSSSDMTLADYWRIETQHPEMDDDKGTSLIAVHSKKALNLLNQITTINRKEVNAAEAYRIQISLRHSMPIPSTRDEFWNSNWQNDFINVVSDITGRKSISLRFILCIKNILRKSGAKRLLSLFSNRFR